MSPDRTRSSRLPSDPHPSRRSSWAALLALLFLATRGAAAPTPRYQVEQRGSVLLFGNSGAYDCRTGVELPLAGVVDPLACGTNTSDTAGDVLWRSDSPVPGMAEATLAIGPGEARTTAVLALPANAIVTYARLYWAADRAGVGADATVVLDGPLGGSQVVNGDANTFVDDFNGGSRYQSTADITTFVQREGVGPFRVSGVDTFDPRNLADSSFYVAWSVVVFYQLDSEPPRNLALIDGLDAISPGTPLDASLSGFLVPPGAGFDGRLAVVAYEGDVDQTGDQLQFNGVALSDAQNPLGNFFNSTRSTLGVPVTLVGDLPRTSGLAGSLSGLDLDIVDVAPMLISGETTATLRARTSDDTVFIGVLATAISSYKPLFTDTRKSLRNLSVTDGTIRPGDTLEYTITARNTGSDRAVDVMLRDVLPAGVSFVPGSIEVTDGFNDGLKTDAADADQAEYVPASRTIAVRLGSGATGTRGGDLPVDSTVTVRLRVTVDAGASGLISNQASVAAAGAAASARGIPAYTFLSSDPSQAFPGRPTTFAVDECRTDNDCPLLLPRCDTSVSPRRCMGCRTDNDCATARPATPVCLPSGACGECAPSNTIHCQGTRPVCELTTNVCRGCANDSECPAATPICLSSGACAPRPSDGGGDGGIGGGDGGEGFINGGGFTCSLARHREGPARGGLLWAGLAVLGLLALRHRRRRPARPATAKATATAAVLAACLLGAPAARAQQTSFALNRYEPTPAGEWSFSVDHPWYSSTRLFAGGVTFNYGHSPLIFGVRDADGVVTRQIQIVSSQFLLHVDLATSFANRVTVSASIPIVLLERGQTYLGISPLAGSTVGDPRFGAMVRLYGEPDTKPFSVNLGAYIWAPLGLSEHGGDRSVRVLPKLVFGGLGHSVRWSVTTGFYYRPDSKIGLPARAPGNASGSELQLGASIYYANQAKRFAIGPEMTFGTVLTGSNPFTREFSSLELLLGLHHNIKSQVMLGVAGGIGLLREPGTPDFRVLLRLAYAPQAKKMAASAPDRDHDGIPDAEDACPDVPGMRSPDPARNGCPPPPRDRDNDGIPDVEDQCPDQQPGDFPDAQRRGCPEDDIDHDGVPNAKDLCPMVPAGPHPDSRRPGCPATDLDGDTFYDDIDECPAQAAGLSPDPMHIGCPLPDRDKDSVPDGADACIDRPGAPDVDPKKNGCPGLVRIERGLIVILSPVFFATDKDVILPRSFPVLQAVVNAINAQPLIKRVAIEGHTDNRGTAEHNRDLSERRAKSVRRWFIAHGVDPERLEAHGYGMDRPIAPNQTAVGRAQNRRVEFHITDPLPPGPGTL